MLSVQQHYLVGEQHQFVGNPLSSVVGRGNVIVQNEHSSDSNSSSCNDSVKDSSIAMSSAQKRKVYGSSLPQQQSSVARRNARERNRVKQVNNGFATLRQHIPDTLATYYASSANAANNGGGGGNGSGSSSASGSKSNSKKLSKVEILRIALKYIETMKSLIDEHDAEMLSQSSPSSSPSPNNLLQTLNCAGMNIDMNYELKSESDEESYAPVQNHYEHQYVNNQDQYQMIQQQPQQLQQQVQQQQQVTYINSNSPTPSFTSEASSTGGSQGYGQGGGSYHTMNSLNLQTQVSFDSAPLMSSEEKDLLHFINQWQNDNQHHQQQQQHHA